jgi:hypothetical protein
MGTSISKNINEGERLLEQLTDDTLDLEKVIDNHSIIKTYFDVNMFENADFLTRKSSREKFGSAGSG